MKWNFTANPDEMQSQLDNITRPAQLVMTSSPLWGDEGMTPTYSQVIENKMCSRLMLLQQHKGTLDMMLCHFVIVASLKPLGAWWENTVTLQSPNLSLAPKLSLALLLSLLLSLFRSEEHTSELQSR